MNEITHLKIEARKLLDEVNRNDERSANGSRLGNAVYGFENNVAEYSFKEKLKHLRQRICALRGRSNHLKSL